MPHPQDRDDGGDDPDESDEIEEALENCGQVPHLDPPKAGRT